MEMLKRCGMALAACAAVALLFTGCSTNKGGDTTCKDFNSQDKETQNAAVEKMLKDQDGKDPSNLEISATRLSAQAFCKTVGKQSSTISDINHG